MRTSDLILGVRVDIATTINSSNPDQESNTEFMGMEIRCLHEWYRINNGEWKRFDHKSLLLDFGMAVNNTKI